MYHVGLQYKAYAKDTLRTFTTLDHERRGDKSVQSKGHQSLRPPPIYSFPTKWPPVVFGRPRERCTVMINSAHVSSTVIFVMWCRATPILFYQKFFISNSERRLCVIASGTGLVKQKTGQGLGLQSGSICIILCCQEIINLYELNADLFGFECKVD